MPNLEHLDLKIQIDDAYLVSTSNRRVELPHLRRLALRECSAPGSCIHILPHLRFPSTTSIRLTAPRFHATWCEGVKQFFNNRSFLPGDEGSLPLRSVAISKLDVPKQTAAVYRHYMHMPTWMRVQLQVESKSSVRLAFWTEVLSFDELLRPRWTTPPRLVLQSKTTSFSTRSLQDGFDALDVVKSISKIETCVIGGLRGSFPPQLPIQMPQVSTLYLSDSRIDSVCDVLAENQSRRRGREKFRFVWPNLKRLVLEKIVLEPNSLGKISHMLEVRRKARTKRRGITTLRLIECPRVDKANFSPYIADVAHHAGSYEQDRLVLQDDF
ncbi:hypothetical protein NLI96_g9442 [Meripilus lineatus]|uniref:Uncharacterized protein n=1 Tax=Meripilus lineatus TaxID=2056292 RepID=A0AAD5YCX3_9APHY|nr:hypothetical protein NLI96_g9442 [Physisporinus lineatus]